jgi:putative transcriptional regulator
LTISRHPEAATLVTCSAGSQPEALCAVIVSHIALCEDCQREYACMETIGLALFETMEAPALETAGAAPSAQAPASWETRPARGDAEVPEPLWPIVRGKLDDLPWRSLAEGVDHYPIDLRERGEGDLRLLRLRPGAAIPIHATKGETHTLVLRGTARDSEGDLAWGDFVDLDDESQRTIMATGDGPCILLIGSETRPPYAR